MLEVLVTMPFSGAQIVNNGGAGIACDPAPAVALVGGSMNIGTVSGNGGGQIACPITF